MPAGAPKIDNLAGLKSTRQPARFNQLLKRFPKRTSVICEGDSWFAYPREWFLAGTEQQVFATESEAGRGRSAYRSGLKDAQRQAARARIAEPVAGTIIALDPDIPAARQRLVLRAEGPAQTLQWRMDGKPIGLGGQLAWNPWPGRHRLTLAQHGRVVDEVRLEVRGAGVKPRGNTEQARSYSQGGAPPAGSSTRQYTLGQASPSGVASDGGTGSRSSVRITSTAPQRASMP